MEFVYVVPRAQLFPDHYPHGLVPFGKEATEGAPSPEEWSARMEQHGFFVERAHAEANPDLKQVIPYTLVVRGGEVLCLQRSRRGGEARLHDKWSIGVGGHINPVDVPSPEELIERADWSPRNPIPKATIREVAEEELSIEGDWRLQPVGLLNDDSNPVGAVHVGWVQVMLVEGTVSVRETDQLSGRFLSIPELCRLGEGGANFETWSELLLPHLGSLVPDQGSSVPQPAKA
jgi:predicted NUDIX family phosphoesterase